MPKPSSQHDENRAWFQKFRALLYDTDPASLAGELERLVAPDARVQLAYPIGSLQGPQALYEQAYAPLLHAVPDLERRDHIVMAGPQDEACWIACAGYYTGVFERPWLGIPATRHVVCIRYCEFFQIQDQCIIALHGLWDIPSVMMQAAAWPMSPSLGREGLIPGPATQDGLVCAPRNEERSADSLRLVDSMLEGLGNFADGGAEAMALEQFWHPKMNWYGPAGIGSNRRLSGFRNWHQVPFLKALPDRRCETETLHVQCYFADGDYVCFCGFNAMHMTVSGDGWMGIAPANQQIHMTSLDFWRCENGRIRENWVLVDILDVYRQLGVDVLARMREYTADRQPNPPQL